MEILHLEDDGPLREIMQIALSAADPNLNMRQFTDSDSAIEYIRKNIENITLFVLDVRVPGKLDGLGVAQQIRELGSERPILVTSAYRKPDQDKMQEYDCQWMAKPWHLLDAPQAILSLASDDNQTTIRAKQRNSSEALAPKKRRSKATDIENLPEVVIPLPFDDPESSKKEVPRFDRTDLLARIVEPKDNNPVIAPSEATDSPVADENNHEI